MTLSPYSPNERVEPRHALPRILPFCCLRNLTFFGINIAKSSKNAQSKLAFKNCLSLKHRGSDQSRLTPLLLVDISAVDPGLHADNSIRGVRLRETIVDIRAQRVQRQA